MGSGNIEPHKFTFNNQLSMSQGIGEEKRIKDILLSEIPGAVNAIQAHTTNDRNGTDWWVEHVSGKFLSVDAKVREEDWSKKNPPQDDLALETWSIIETQKIGWSRDFSKRTDYVLWFWKDTKRWLLVPFAFLCKIFRIHWEEWKKIYKTSTQETSRPNGGTWHSECTFVPRSIVWRTIYEHYGGKPNN